MNQQKNDFCVGPMWKNILSMAVPITVAQLVQLLYNIVDRIYVGHLPGDSGLALTGMGLTFPILQLVSAFTFLYSTGGAPLCSIARGQGNLERAEKLMSTCFTLLFCTGLGLMAFFYIFMKPVLYLFGASDATYPYAAAYLQIYLAGTLFVMAGVGLNAFINAQGFGRVAMCTTLLGAGINLLLDPLFIFVFGWGVRGAALATIISQGVSALWVVRFLCGKKALFTLKRSQMKLDDGPMIKRIISLGLSGFIMAVTNSLTQIVCNATLQRWGGDLYVGVMTVINSVREVFTLVAQGTTQGAQPVIGFNYGAKQYRRVRQGILFITLLTTGYSLAAWLVVDHWPALFLGMFSTDQNLIATGIPALRIFFAAFFMMSFQFSGQSTFVALGYSKYAVFFSLLRKAFIVVPLTLLLPLLMGVDGVFAAEPISNVLGGLACYCTMLWVVWRGLKKAEQAETQVTS